MEKQRFSIDFLDGEIFDGYTNGEYWNGFACPYFTFEQAQAIVSASRARGFDARYDAEADQFTFEMQNSESEDDRDSFPAVKIDNLKVYPIGAHCWIWDEVSQEDAA